MDRGLQKIAMADDLDVDALLEAPYTKYEVGTTTDHSVSWLLWSCPFTVVALLKDFQRDYIEVICDFLYTVLSVK